ncbi:DUF3313 domain-containing protein [Phenylobacterium sp. J367]|uniref:DUF3313 domain-containing protein n=1 Tax=Phenylobacterium sp. J367 TaxID=2898435 RepID=UPI002150F0E3|nr:DUF3313 domain-containing protein [Phenylobacterium sp. J367]MCR5878821.1 DUF3313 domain-containing protein [Phenylobacterium sp. J367]
MDRRQLFPAALGAMAAVGAAGPALAAKPPKTWDGLVQAKAKRFDLVYLAPGADFRVYSKVMLDPVQVAFEKNWRRDYNNSQVGLSGRVSEKDLQEAIAKGIVAAHDIYADELNKGGYPVVEAAGPDVVRLTIGILNIRVSAPDIPQAGRSYQFAEEAGEATLVVEVRDSETNALLGRAADRRVAGDTTVGWRTRVSNQADFRRLVKTWAQLAVRGLNEVKALSPINEQGLTGKA